MEGDSESTNTTTDAGMATVPALSPSQQNQQEPSLATTASSHSHRNVTTSLPNSKRKTTHSPSSSSAAAAAAAASPSLSNNESRPVIFSLLLDPVLDSETSSSSSSSSASRSTANSTATSRICVTSRAVHTMFGNEQGLFDGGANTKMDRPMGLSLSPTGFALYFCEFGSHTIRRANLGGPQVDTLAGTAGAGYQDGLPSTARFCFPEDVCVVPILSRASDNNSLKPITGVTGSDCGAQSYVLAVADTGNHAIRCIDPATGVVSTLLQGQRKIATTSARRPFDCISVDAPRGLCAAGPGHPGVFFVCDSTKIIEINITTQSCRILAGGGDLTMNDGAGERGFRNGSFREALFDRPTGLTFDASNGHLYVADTCNHVIRCLYDNVVSTVAGCGREGYVDGRATDHARFKFPQKIAVDAGRQLLYVSELNDVLRRVELNVASRKKLAAVFTQAGSGRRGHQDGMVSTSMWSFPAGLVFSEHEDVLYCCDSDNHCIRLVMAHDGWVEPLNSTVYVQRALSAYDFAATDERQGAGAVLGTDVTTTFKKRSELSSSNGVAEKNVGIGSGVSGRTSSRNSPRSDQIVDPVLGAMTDTPIVLGKEKGLINMNNKAQRRLPKEELSFYETPAMTKYEKTVAVFATKANGLLKHVHFKIFRSKYMMNHPSKTALLLATAVMVILQYPVSADDMYEDESIARQRMMIFKDSKLLSKLKSMPCGALSTHQAAKLFHCVQRIEHASMSRAPDMIRLKKWILVRAEAERFISDHRVRALDQGPFRSSAPTNKNEGDLNPTTHNSSSAIGNGRSIDTSTFSALWNQETGDPEIFVPMRSTVDSAATPRIFPTESQHASPQRQEDDSQKPHNDNHRYSALSFRELCSENELLRREVERLRQSNRVILDTIEGAMTSSRASANHLSLHALLGMPQQQQQSQQVNSGSSDGSTALNLQKQMPATDTSKSNDNNNLGDKRSSTLRGSDVDTSGAAGLSAAHVKKRRQARQASIIIEELERALGESSSKWASRSQRGARGKKDDELEEDESDVGSYAGGDLSD